MLSNNSVLPDVTAVYIYVSYAPYLLAYIYLLQVSLLLNNSGSHHPILFHPQKKEGGRQIKTKIETLKRFALNLLKTKDKECYKHIRSTI